MKTHLPPLNILLADDDKDDRFFFRKALEALTIPTKVQTVNDGAELMQYLSREDILPEVLFLDLNMPCKNGSECLSEIKASNKLKEIPVIIYSTSLYDDVADLLYTKGAHYYIRKTDLDELRKILAYLLPVIREKNFVRPLRRDFIFNMPEVPVKTGEKKSRGY
ncbi:MAG: response regulator [Bacteroidota bacterium]|nr:response regulator [Bacteroidota bacterium]